MNNKGQTLLVFVILLPVCLLFLAFVIDTGLIIKEYLKVANTMKITLETTYDKKIELDYIKTVKNVLNKNEIATENLEVIVLEKEIKMKNELEIESIFGKIINIQKYKIKINLKATKQENKIRIEKE